jgi:DNA-binding transcriptional MerR regulator
MEKINKLFTIGQFAALHGVNKKTLMWYNQIGLFRPAAVDPDNGYRLYSYRQSSVLETILLLRELDVSLEEIETFLAERSAKGLERLLGEKITEVDGRIARLRGVRAALARRREDVRALLRIDLSEIQLVEREERSLVTVDVRQDAPFDKQVELVMAETKRYQLRRLHDAVYGTMISVESLKRGNFEDYSKLFIEIPEATKNAGSHMRPGGQWVRAYYQGPWDKMSRRYGEVFQFLQARGLEPYGWAYEAIVNESVAQGEEDAVVRIELSVRQI